MTAEGDHSIRTAGKFFRRGGEKWLLKGVSYGPFEGAEALRPPDVTAEDLRRIAALGFNTVRVYSPPPVWFLDACVDCGLVVLAGLQWPAHTDFLRDWLDARDIVNDARETVRRLRGHPALLGWLVANEVPALMVRWMGRRRVRDFLEEVIATCRREDADVLFAYATYPSTEYLSPRNADFVAFNVYLEDAAAWAAYLCRLQHVAGDVPLVITEFGLDTVRHGETAQAQAVDWAWEAALRSAVAGQVLFAWTDDWFTGGRDMSGAWGFGITTADRREKEACTELREWLPQLRRHGQAARLALRQRISVVICTHNGARTLRTALESVQQLAYADYEVIVVDDGSTDAVPEIVAEFRDVRCLRIDHSGLSAARNHGARAATGEIIAYLDDDAAADDEWLTFLALGFEDPRVGCVGGPNIPPMAQHLVEACVAAAPGGPAHVMLNDREAEHLPGCNLAVRRTAWEETGGFDERHRTAGDDVDFCWRLMEHGWRLVFEPGAMVWHARRATVRAYLRQQAGYGAAEAALIAQHRHRFGKLGGARWRGAIYEPVARALAPAAFIYQGVFGTAPYQFLYTAPHTVFADVVTGLPWGLAAAAMGVGACWVPELSWVALAMLAVPVGNAVRFAWQAPEVRWEGRPPGGALLAKVLLAFLALAQPFVRSTVRWLGCLRRVAFPRGPWFTGPLFRRPRWRRRKAVSEAALWNEHGRDRQTLLTGVLATLEEAGWRVTVGDAWTDWDFEVPRSPWWTVRCVTTTEFHHGEHRLTRVRLHTRATALTTFLATLTVAGVICLLTLRMALGLWSLAITFLIWLALEFHHGAVASQVMRLILHEARQHGMRRVGGDDPPAEHDTRENDPEPTHGTSPE